MPPDHHEHGHDQAPGALSPSGHPYRADQDGPLTRLPGARNRHTGADDREGSRDRAEVAAQVEAMDARSPAQGAALVARAWADAAFRARLLADGSAACAEMGFDVGR